MLQQLTLFGEAVTVKTKAVKPKTVEMFPASQVLQFGVKARPTMPIPHTATTRLGLFAQDNRTQAERERDNQRDSLKNNLTF